MDAVPFDLPLPVDLLIAGVIIGLVGWSIRRWIKRIDDSYDGVYSHGGPVGTVRQELTSIRTKLGGFMTRKEFEENQKSVRQFFETIQREAGQREARMLKAIADHSARSIEETKEIREDLRGLSKRIDHLADK